METADGSTITEPARPWSPLALPARARGAAGLLGGSAKLAGRAALPLLRTVAAGSVLLAVLLVPLWIWINVAVQILDLDGAALGTADLVRIVLLVVVPAVAVLGIVVLATFGAATIVLDDVAAGRRPRAVRALGAGVRAVPRMVVAGAPAVVVVSALVVAAPEIVLLGLVLAPVTAVGRRVRPGGRWPSWRTILTMVIPFGVAAVVAARWTALPAALVLERSGPRSSFSRSRTITAPRVADVALAIVLLALVLAVALAGAGLLLGATGASATTTDLVRVLIEGVALLVLAALVVTVFVDGGGQAVERPEPIPPRVGLSALVVFALLAGLVPVLLAAPAAHAVTPGATIVVDSLGDAADADAGDGTCATDAGACTLRAAVDEANASTGEVIGFSVSGTVTVASELVLTAPVTIDGADRQVVVSGGGTTGVFRTQMEVAGGGSGAIRNLTIADGYDGSLGGAALFNNGASAGFTLDRVTVRDSAVAAGTLFGGAVLNTSKLDIVNSTFSGNAADGVEGADVANVFSGELSIRQSTFVGASGPSAVSSTGSSLAVTNSIVSGGTFACNGTITGAGNVSTDAAAICPGAVAAPAALELQPLADNGGPTPTVRVTPLSEAVDAGDPAACLLADQRGRPRPKGANCDAGAYELDPATTTVLTTSPNPSSVGQTVVLDVEVSAVEPGAPTGTIELRDGPATIGSVVLGDASDGRTAWETPDLPAGTHALTAVYVPDGGLATSTSAPVSQVVEASATTVTLTSDSSATVGGEAVTFTVEVAGPGPVPTGDVTLLDGDATLALLTLDAAGRATHTTSTLSGGHHVLTARYAGDPAHLPAESAPIDHDVVAASGTTVTGPPGPTVYGTDATFEVLVTPTGGGIIPTGGVTLLDGGAEVGTGTLDGDGRVSITVASLTPGTHSVQAAYHGDPFNDESTSAAVDHVVTPAATVTSLTVDPDPSSVFGTTVTLTATVDATASPVTPEGTVTFFDGTAAIGSTTVTDGVATLSIASLLPAVHDLRAGFAPATGFDPSSSPAVAHTVVVASATVALSASSAASVFGEPVTFEAAATSLDSPRTPSGTITFRDAGVVLAVVPLDAGVARLPTSALEVGTRTITAQYNGDGGFASATSADLVHTVAPAPVSVAIGDTPDPSVFGATVAVSIAVAAVPPGAGTPTGTVVVREGTTVLATVTLDGAGHGSADLGGLAVGTHTLVADYVGGGNFAAGSATTDHTVAGDTATVDLSSSSPSITFGDPVTFTATVTGTGAATPTGTVTFRDGATVLGTRVLVSGVARLTVTDLRFGTFPVTADYSGDAGFGAADDSIVQRVDAATTGITLTVDPVAPTVDDLVTLTATVAGTGTARVPSGTITFVDGGVVLATATVDAQGVATHQQTFGRSVHSLTARFTGTPGWASSSSNTVTVTPSRSTSTISLSGAPSPVGVGGPVTWTATFSRALHGPVPTGSVQFWSGATALGGGTISDGTATLTVPAPSTVGPWAVFVTYGGDLNHEQAVSPPASVIVTAAGTTTTPVVPPTAYVTDDVELAAVVTSELAGTPVAGSVRFTSDAPGVPPQSGPVDAAGRARVLVTDLPAGTWTVTATFVPVDGSPFGASSASAPIAVQRRAASVALQVPSTITVGVPFSAGFAVADRSGTGPTPTGTVTVSGGDVSCSAPATAGRCTLTLPAAGPVDLTASYSGDRAYEPATSSPARVRPVAAVTRLSAWSPTATWATGDPIRVLWRLEGPRSGEVVVRTPFGEACRSTVIDLGSCTVTFPFDQRGQTVPIDVSYAGTDAWAPAAAQVTGTLVGCYALTFEVVPSAAGTIDPPAGNCNGGTGTLGGTTVAVEVVPTPPYVVDHWLEDGSTARARSFVVGDGSTTATALMTADCVQVSVAATEQVDLGPARSRGGSVALTPPDCPGRSTVEVDPATATTTAWYRPGTSVTVTATPTRPGTDELKGWYVDPVLSRSSAPFTFVAADDIAVEARFGVRCATPRLTSLGGGSVDLFSPTNCIDAAGDWSWQMGSSVGAHVVPDAFHWIAGWSTPPAREIPAPHQWIDEGSTVEGANAFWDLRPGLAVEVSFETCRELTLDARGPGRVDTLTAPDCPTRPAHTGNWYRPTTTVDLAAVPDGPSTRRYSHESADGTIVEGFAEVQPTFRDWEGVDESWSQPAGEPTEPLAAVALRDSRTVTAHFFDEGRCAPLVLSSVPAGIADLSVDLAQDDGSCPAGQYRQYDRYVGDTATFHASNIQTGRALEGWHVSTSLGADAVDHLVWNDAPDVAIEGPTFATAYICRAIIPEVTLIAPDGSTQSGVAPPDASFVSADSDGDCPLWDNAYSIGSTVRIAALAPVDGYTFRGWEGDLSGTDPAVEIWFNANGTFWRPTSLDAPEASTAPWQLLPRVEDRLRIRAVYDVNCVPLYVTPPALDGLSVGPEGNCPGADTEAPVSGATRYRFIAGTPVLLDAHHVEDHDTVPWSVVEPTDPRRLLNRDQAIAALRAEGIDDLADVIQGLDHPAMLTMESQATIDLPYREHGSWQQLGDDLAVTGKKLIGFMANFAIGTFETTTGLVFGRLALMLMDVIATSVDPDGPAGTYFRDAQEGLDVLEMGFICTKEWSTGGERPPPPPNPFAADDQVPASEPPGAEEVLLRRNIKITTKATKTVIDQALQRHIVRLGYKTTELAAQQAKYLKYATYFNKGLGAAIGVGTQLYFTYANGPGARYDDTAQEAWEQGGEVFTECLYRQIAEASDGHLPIDIPE